MDPLGSGLEVRMHDRDTVELALMALAEGWSSREAAELVGASKTAVCRWAREGAPHERRAGRIGGGRTRREEAPMDESERAAYEAAMTENMLLRAVLDDLKAAGSDPRSISRRRRVELGERLRAATGLPLREITRFLGISRSSYAYHRARLGRDRYAALRLEVRELFREAVVLAAADRGAVAIRTDIEPADTMIYADRALLGQVAVNLLKNAREAVGDKPDGWIEIRSRIDAAEQVVIEISNNGGAIPAEVIENIFTPFYTTKPDGSGIGLSLSRRIMQLHGGSLRLTCNTAQRVTFTLRID